MTNFRIGLVGSPGSGKSTFAAMLYAEMLQRGINSSRLVLEKALDHLGAGEKIDTPADQIVVTHKQMHAEATAILSNFNPIICDSAIFSGEVYMMEKLNKHPETDLDKELVGLSSVDRYMDVMNKYKGYYNAVVYCPLVDETSQLNKFRIHNIEQSRSIDQQMQIMIEGLPKNVIVFKLSKSYPERVKDLVGIANYIQQNYLGVKNAIQSAN